MKLKRRSDGKQKGSIHAAIFLCFCFQAKLQKPRKKKGGGFFLSSRRSLSEWLSWRSSWRSSRGTQRKSHRMEISSRLETSELRFLQIGGLQLLMTFRLMLTILIRTVQVKRFSPEIYSHCSVSPKQQSPKQSITVLANTT